MTLVLARIFAEIWLPAFVQFAQVEHTDAVMVIKACELFLGSKLFVQKLIRVKQIHMIILEKKKCDASIQLFNTRFLNLPLDCDSITKNAVALSIDDAFYEEHLSTPEKIQATAKRRDLVTLVEEISNDWMRIIEKILVKGKVIRRNETLTGPIDELEHWLQTHSMYSIAQELITTPTFENHMKCLQLSGSKLVHVICLILFRIAI